MTFAWVALGGALGACMRAALSAAVSASLGPRFPHALYVVNATGSLLLGVVIGSVDPAAHPLLISGLCGALTTYSTFAHATVELLREQRYAAAALHVALNLIGTLLAVALGMTLSGAYQ